MGFEEVDGLCEAFGFHVQKHPSSSFEAFPHAPEGCDPTAGIKHDRVRNEGVEAPRFEVEGARAASGKSLLWLAKLMAA